MVVRGSEPDQSILAAIPLEFHSTFAAIVIEFQKPATGEGFSDSHTSAFRGLAEPAATRLLPDFTISEFHDEFYGSSVGGSFDGRLIS